MNDFHPETLLSAVFELISFQPTKVLPLNNNFDFGRVKYSPLQRRRISHRCKMESLRFESVRLCFFTFVIALQRVNETENTFLRRNRMEFLKLGWDPNFLEFANILNFLPMKRRKLEEPIEMRSLLELWKSCSIAGALKLSSNLSRVSRGFKSISLVGDAFEILVVSGLDLLGDFLEDFLTKVLKKKKKKKKKYSQIEILRILNFIILT